MQKQCRHTLLTGNRQVRGMQRITVTIDNQTEHTPYIDVDPIQEKGFLEDSIGATNPYILGTTIVMLFIGLISILAWMRLLQLSITN